MTPPLAAAGGPLLDAQGAHAGRRPAHLPRAGRSGPAWRPDLQETKRSQTGGVNVRYRAGTKGRYVAELTELVGRILPECPIRYAF